MKNAKFTGGPLDGMKMRQDVYARVVPMKETITGRIISYYLCVNQPRTLVPGKKPGPLHYVFHVNGSMYASVDKLGRYVK